MKKFLENLIILVIYSLLFCILLIAAKPHMTAGYYIGYSMILGVFAGLFNNVERIVRGLFKRNNEK